uniref:Uncharacterized protein n=1 Tax=Arundo donax TaxID=35708 RepID=A0A0A8YVP9_ARUDO
MLKICSNCRPLIWVSCLSLIGPIVFLHEFLHVHRNFVFASVAAQMFRCLSRLV